MKKLIAVLALVSTTALHGAPPVYKCTAGKQTTYSNEPCVGAQILDVTPTRGAEYLGKRSAVGALRDAHETVRTMLQPITGLSPSSFDKMQERDWMDASRRAECYRLDTKIKPQPGQDERELFTMRKRYRDLDC